MTIEQAKEWLEYIKTGYSWCANCDKALDKAIASLEAWDKVKKEIKEIKTTDVNRCKTMAIHIINKHLKEEEK